MFFDNPAIGPGILPPSLGVNYPGRYTPLSGPPSPSLSPGDKVSHAEKHIVDGRAFRNTCRGTLHVVERGIGKRMGKISSARTSSQLTQVRQLDSTCNLIFTLLATAQTWTLLSYRSLTKRRRSHLFRTTAP